MQLQFEYCKMRMSIFLLLFLRGLRFSEIHASQDLAEPPRDWIVGGVKALPHEYPPAARLGHRSYTNNQTTWFCGGTLISRRLVLTAAHCFYSDVGSVNIVRLGELVFDDDKDDAEPEDFEVLERMLHPGFRYPVLYSDIGIIRLRGEVIYNPYKLPACLPLSNGDLLESFTAIGWGQTGFSQLEQSKELRKVVLQNYGNSCRITTEANEGLPEGYRPASQLCVGSPEHKDTCNGDSGGPLLISHTGDGCQYQVMGIKSVGIACDTPDFPSLYTRVHYFRDWIKGELVKT